MKSIKEIRDAFLKMHHYATTEGAPTYMSVPADPERDADLIVSAAIDELERLRASGFKAYVHERLDRAGVPLDPPGPHRDAGCRIGQRLDHLLDERTALRAQVVELERDLERVSLELGDMQRERDADRAAWAEARKVLEQQVAAAVTAEAAALNREEPPVVADPPYSAAEVTP